MGLFIVGWQFTAGPRDGPTRAIPWLGRAGPHDPVS